MNFKRRKTEDLDSRLLAEFPRIQDDRLGDMVLDIAVKTFIAFLLVFSLVSFFLK